MKSENCSTQKAKEQTYFLFLHNVQDSCGFSLLRCGRGPDFVTNAGVDELILKHCDVAGNPQRRLGWKSTYVIHRYSDGEEASEDGCQKVGTPLI